MYCRARKGNRRRAGMTLVEMMVVLVIIGLLASVVTIKVRTYINKARQNTARQEIAVIVQALETYYAAYGRYPGGEEGIDALLEPSDKLPDALLDGDPTDPWGRAYVYNSPGSTGPYEVICYGGDGSEGGEGIDADISSDNLKE